MISIKRGPGIDISRLSPQSSCILKLGLSVDVRRNLRHSAVLGNKRAELGQKILNKVPKFLKPYTINFVTRPVSNLTSFLILHEFTAIGPLIGLWYAFHKYQISIPLDLPQWAIDKGTKVIDESLTNFDFTDFSLNDKFKLIAQGAYAYVIVKALLPLRVIVSFALTPVFTRFIIDPILLIFRGRVSKEKYEKTVIDEKAHVKNIKKPRL